MANNQARKWAGYPPTIFGLTCTQHRIPTIRQLFEHYTIWRPTRATKRTLLRDLLDFQTTLTIEEQESITQWFLQNKVTLDAPRPVNPALYVNGLQYGHHFGRRILIPNARDLGPAISRGPSHGEAAAAVAAAVEVKVSECIVCMEDLTQFAPFPTLSAQCKHPPEVCPSCITQHVDTQIQEVAWDMITCPTCPELLSFYTIKDHASPESYERYDQNTFLSAIKDFPNFIMCLGPNCGSGQIHGGGDARPIMTCSSCHFKTCFTHKLPWHSGQTCSEYDASQRERAEQEAASAALLSTTAKICPNEKCGLNVMKVSGCDHMTCHRCRHQFCWLCLAPYKEIVREGNSAHALTCRYHSNNI